MTNGGRQAGSQGSLRERDWTPIPDCEGAQLAETSYVPFHRQGNRVRVRLIARRFPPDLGPLPEGQPGWRYHMFITDREGGPLHLEKDHRRHAECEGAIRDLKYGVGLNHFPSGNFCANAAWLWIQCLSHNICRWLRQIGDPRGGVMTAATLRRRVISIPGRITSSGRQSFLRLPGRWPWAVLCLRIFNRVKAAPEPA